jgi:hypothetical protein
VIKHDPGFMNFVERSLLHILLKYCGEQREVFPLTYRNGKLLAVVLSRDSGTNYYVISCGNMLREKRNGERVFCLLCFLRILSCKVVANFFPRLFGYFCFLSTFW